MSVNVNAGYGINGTAPVGGAAGGVAVGLEKGSNPANSILPPNGKGVHKLALVPANRIRVGSQFRDILGDLNSVASTIGNDGLLQPPVVTVSNSEDDQETWYDLVAGFRRLKAMTEFLKWDAVPVLVAIGIDPLDAKMAENVERLDPTASERVKAGLDYEKKYARKTGRPEKDAEDPDKGKSTNELIAKRVGLGSAENYRKAKKVYLSGNAELITLMNSGPHKVDAAYTALKAKEAQQKAKDGGAQSDSPTGGQKAMADENRGKVRSKGAFAPSRSPSESTPAAEEPTPGDAFKVRPFIQAMVDVRKCLEEHGAFELKPEVVDGVLHLPAEDMRLALIVALFKVKNIEGLIREGKLNLKVAE